MAVGRRILTADLGLDDLGVEPGRPIEVDDTLRVPGHDWLYAIGDVNGRALLTHMGKYQGRIAADRILGREVAPAQRRRASARASPSPTRRSRPSATRSPARRRPASTPAPSTSPPAATPAARSSASARRARRGSSSTRTARVIVGATFTGAEIAEALHAATIAVIGEVPLDDLWHAVPCFPTRSELWLKLLEEYGL